MKTDSIIDILESLFGKGDNFTEEELNSINSLNISRTDYGNKLLSVDFSDLLNFKNVVSLTINGCSIDNKAITYISNLDKINYLSLFDCIISDDIYPLFVKLDIKNLRIENTNFDLEYLDEYYERLTLSNVIFKVIKSFCKTLDVSNCNINDISLLLESNFEEAIVSKKFYLENEETFNNCSKKIIVMDDNGQFVFKKVGF